MENAPSFLRLFVLSLMVACSLMQPAAAQPRSGMSYQVFYDELSPYGQWIDDPQYGYVWVPNVASDFRPYYSNGYWVMTAYGNTWYSDYPWGWAPFHYGRWTYDPYYGWVWIPGYEWAPAWVCWRHGFGYYGWAPLSPGFAISISFASYWCPTNWWIFIPPAHIHQRHFHRYWKGPRNNDNIIHRTTIITNTHTNRGAGHVEYPPGPDLNDIRTQTGIPVTVYQLSELSQPGNAMVTDNTLHIYRPGVVDDERINPPRQAIKAPHPIGNPAEVGDNAEREPGFRAVQPVRNVPTPDNPPAKNPIQGRPVQPVESRPSRMERPVPKPEQNQPVRQEQNSKPAGRYDDEIYRARPQRAPEANPVNRTTVEPRSEPPRQPVTRPVERPAQPPIQPNEPRTEQPRREMPVPQPRRDDIRPIKE